MEAPTKEIAVFMGKKDRHPILEIHEIDLETGEIEGYFMYYSQSEMEEWLQDNGMQYSRFEHNHWINEYAKNNRDLWENSL